MILWPKPILQKLRFAISKGLVLREVREYDETCVCLDEIKAKISKKCSTAAHNVEEVVFEGDGLEMGKLFAIYNLFLH